MKRFLILLSAVLAIFSGSVYAAGEAQLYIDGDRLECENAPIIINDRVLVPMRVIFEALDASVEWDGNSRTVKAEREDSFLYIPVETDYMTVGVYNSDGCEVVTENIYLDVPSMIYDDRTYVPVRAVSETLGATVSWDGESGRVIIDSRKDKTDVIYYVSDSDYQRLYCIEENGRNRKKLSENSVSDIEMYNGSVYYVSGDEQYLCCANAKDGEKYLVKKAVSKLGISNDGWLYYSEVNPYGRAYGIIFRINLDSGEIQQITEETVRYPLWYKNYIYFNLDGDNNMYAVKTDGTDKTAISLGDSEHTKLYTFNCVFAGDTILVENNVLFGNIIGLNLDGSNMHEVSVTANSEICRNITEGDEVIYISSVTGQSIYYAKTDGSEMHLVTSTDPTWLGLDVLARYENIIYYKNPMRDEVYRVSLDGSDNAYVCCGDEVKFSDGRLFASFNGLYVGSYDGCDLACIYNREVKAFDVSGDTVYLTDKASSRLYTVGFEGNKNAVTSDSVKEWICEKS